MVLICISITANVNLSLFKNIYFIFQFIFLLLSSFIFPLLKNTCSSLSTVFIGLSIFFFLICRNLFYILEVDLLWLYVLHISLQRGLLVNICPGWLSPAFQEKVTSLRLKLKMSSKWKTAPELILFQCISTFA